MTTKVGNSDGNTTNSVPNQDNSEVNFIPALGESWAHATTTRLLLMFDKTSLRIPQEHSAAGLQKSKRLGSRRICKLVKSPHRASGSAFYDITERGLRDFVQ